MKYLIDIVFDGTRDETEAQILAERIAVHLGAEKELRIIPCPKFDSSYKIELAVVSNKDEHHVEEAVALADRICSPWLVLYYDDEKKIELIFNRDKNSNFAENEFQKIRWADLQMS